MPPVVVSKLGLHCLHMSPNQVSGLKRVKDFLMVAGTILVSGYFDPVLA